MSENGPACDYCEGTTLAYRLRSDRGDVCRCIVCLAIEQGQQKLRLPLDSYDGLDADLLVSSYQGARDWFSVLARLNDDEPLVKRDPDAIGTLDDTTRTFLLNIMGDDAHKRPSAVTPGSGDTSASQLTFASSGVEDPSGLFAKYDVAKDGESVDECFVLEPGDDPAAAAAAEAYAKATDDETLAADLRAWIADLEGEDCG